MSDIDDLDVLYSEAIDWRRRLHQIPELEFEVYETARFVADKLASFGIDHIETGIARTGIVALIKGRFGAGPTIGLRADMDALPIHEETGVPWSSRTAGHMHACGHDGHIAMLLGAAKRLAATRNFKGTVALIFQPAEEGAPSGWPQGAQKMVEEGIFDRFGISQVFGMHNDPTLPVGEFAICDGPIMAALDEFDLVVKGQGGHGGRPQDTIDPVVIAAQIVMGLQTLVSRSTSPQDSLVLSITQLNAGTGYNIIPAEVAMAGCVRTVAPALWETIEQQVGSIAQSIAQAFGGRIELTYRRPIPVTANHFREARLSAAVAKGIVGADHVNDGIKPRMEAEDFGFMLQARPGAFIFIGSGARHGLHHPRYDFNDATLSYGIRYWTGLVDTIVGPHAQN